MRTLAIISRTTKRGYTSTWHFVEGADGFYAFGGCHQPLVKRFATAEELRDLYAAYCSYGYRPVTEQLELPLVAFAA